MFRPRLLPLVFLLAACAEVPTGPLEPSQIAVATAPGSGTPGWLLDAPLSVRVTDLAGHPVAGVTVTWRAEAEGAQVETATPAPSEHFEWNFDPRFVTTSSSVTNADGVAQVRYLVGWTSGTQRVLVSAGQASLAVSIPVSSFGAKSVALTGTHACGLDDGGRLYCWRPTWRRRDEVPTVMPVTMRPVAANTTDRFTMLTGGADADDVVLCGLTTTQEVRCFSNVNFDAAGAVTPVAVATPVAFRSIAGSMVGVTPATGATLCGLDDAGQAWCRGQNGDGQLGDGTKVSRSSFALVSGGHQFTALTTAAGRACALDVAGAAWCWGQGPAISIGVSTPFLDDTTIPTAVGVGKTFRDVAPLGSGACGIETVTNQLDCWGYAVVNRVGVPKGTATVEELTMPLKVVGSPPVLAMSGDATASAQYLATDGRIANWGDQVPDFDLQLVLAPEFGAGLTGFSAILARGTGAICSSHSSGSTVCSWAFYRGVGVPVPN